MPEIHTLAVDRKTNLLEIRLQQRDVADGKQQPVVPKRTSENGNQPKSETSGEEIKDRHKQISANADATIDNYRHQ